MLPGTLGVHATLAPWSGCGSRGADQPGRRDLDGNVERVLAAYAEAADLGAHLVVFPELALTGYPPEDLVFKPSFLAASRAAAERVAAQVGEAAAVVGFVEPTHAGPADAAALCHRGRVLACTHGAAAQLRGVRRGATSSPAPRCCWPASGGSRWP